MSPAPTQPPASPRPRRRLLAVWLVLGGVAAGGCSVTFPRQDCTRDRDCPAGEVCFPDDLCVPVGIALRRGGTVGDDCSVENGEDVGCQGAEVVCRMRRCVGPGGFVACEGTEDNAVPLFGGPSSAFPDGEDAILVSWAPASDETPHEQLTYSVFMSTTEGEFDLEAPVATVVGGVQHREDGLTAGTTYFFMVRATDEAGFTECNDTVVSASPLLPGACVDFQSNIQPLLEANCVRCHAGENPPQNLRLDSYEGVIAGGRSGNEVVRCQADASLIYLKVALEDPPVGARMPLDGPPFLSEGQIDLIRRWIEDGARNSCDEPDACSDAVPPEFGGLTSATATSATTAELCWTAGTDDLTPPEQLLYDVFIAADPGGQDLDVPAATSTPGAACITVSTLSPNTEHCFVVRARDGASNRDDNTVERCLTQPALAAGCVDHAAHIQPLFDRHCVRCHSGAEAPQGLRLTTFGEAIAGSVRRSEVDACNAAGSLLPAKLKPNPPVGERMPLDGPPYLTGAQIAMVEQWIDNGASASCEGASSPCADTQPPTFGGATTATGTGPTNIQVCWDAPSDDTTPAEALRVELYESLTPGGQAFGEPAQHAVVNATCADIPVAPGTQLCVVARARDAVGNVSANLEERCATTPAADCAIEFASHIRPVFAARCNHCHQAGNPPRFLDLTSYAGLLAGGSLRNEILACDPAGSMLSQKVKGSVCGRRMPFDGPPWLSPAQLSLIDSWIISGARETCGQESPCADTTPPTFAGVTTVTAEEPTTARVCWAAATDDTSAGSQITYDLYEGSSGGQQFGAPASYSGPAGTTCLDIPVAPSQQTCFVVRARDLRGNHDGNAVEACVTPPAGCVDYGARVQTIFNARCIQCHSGSGAPDGIQWDSYDHAVDTGDVEACDTSSGDLVDVVEACEMPFDTSSEQCSTRACLTRSQIQLIRAWINQGASQSCPAEGC